MADWEREIIDEGDRGNLPPLQTQAQPAQRPAISRLGSKQRRQMQQPATAATEMQPAAYRPAMPQRPIAYEEDDDPFAAHARPSPPSASAYPASAAQQPYVHPLMAEPFRPPPQRDPNMQRIESTLRDTLTRDPSTFSAQREQLPPLSRPAIPPLKLGDVIKQVLGPRALTNPNAAPAFTNQTQANLREKVAKMRLHENINPSLTPAGDPMAGLEADKAGYLNDGATITYDENDDEDDSLGADNPRAAETRPLSPRKTLPTSRLPIDPDDLARKPDELRGAPVSREELMHFRRNEVGMGGIGSAPTVGTVTENKVPTKSAALSETYVESKTTGEFIRVRQTPEEHAQAGDGRGQSRSSINNIHDFDQQIDTILGSVDSIQAQLSGFWLLVSGLLVGAALLQVYLVYLKTSDTDFLSYYSVLAGPSRKVIYVLLGFSVTLACWRFSLERYDADRHVHFIARYYQPNNARWVWIRNLVCASAFGLGFLMTLIMVPLDDYMENQWTLDSTWYLASTGLPSYFTDRISSWYAMAMVRLVCVSIGWLCIIHRFGYAEYNYLELQQERAEQRQQRGSFLSATNAAGLSRTSRGQSVGAGTYGVDSGLATARSSRITSTSNGAAVRLDASAMAVPPRR